MSDDSFNHLDCLKPGCTEPPLPQAHYVEIARILSKIGQQQVLVERHHRTLERSEKPGMRRIVEWRIMELCLGGESFASVKRKMEGDGEEAARFDEYVRIELLRTGFKSTWREIGGEEYTKPPFGAVQDSLIEAFVLANGLPEEPKLENMLLCPHELGEIFGVLHRASGSVSLSLVQDAFARKLCDEVAIGIDRGMITGSGWERTKKLESKTKGLYVGGIKMGQRSVEQYYARLEFRTPDFHLSLPLTVCNMLWADQLMTTEGSVKRRIELERIQMEVDLEREVVRYEPRKYSERGQLCLPFRELSQI